MRWAACGSVRRVCTAGVQGSAGWRSGFPASRVSACCPMSRDISWRTPGIPRFIATEGTMATGYNVRMGDADREAVAAQLREHYADGRLTLDELNERLDQTFAAKTKADLDVVLRDLPHVARPLTDAPAAGFGNTAWQGQAWPGPTGRSSWDYGTGNAHRCGRSAFAPVMTLLWVLLVIGAVTLFGIGGDRPLAI